MSKNDGGNAFPQWHPELMNQPEFGMSLRDYFAAKAQAGMLANYNVINTPAHVAQMAYAHADAMLAERSEPSEQGGPLLDAVKALIAAEGGISIVHQKSHDAFERVRRLAERAK